MPVPTLQFSESEIADFHRDGFAVVRGLIPGEMAQRMKSVTLRDLAAAEPGPVELEAELAYPGAPSSVDDEGGQTIRRLKMAVARDPVFVDCVSRPEVSRRLRQLLGEIVVMPLAHHNCIMTKRPRFSSDTGWHQDFRYWSFDRPDLISLWIALGDEHSENGGLKLLPGTHATDFNASQFDTDQFLDPSHSDFARVTASATTVSLTAGDVLFFHCRTFHAASRNRTAEQKYSVVFTFRSGDNPPKPGSRSASLPELVIPSLW